MIASDYLDWLEEELPGNLYSSRQRLLSEVNRSQNEILGQDNKLMLILPDPLLVTVDGTTDYVANSSIYYNDEGALGDLVDDIRVVRDIYVYGPTGYFDTTVSFGGQDNPDTFESRYGADITRPRWDADESLGPNLNDCRIMFYEQNNPGAQQFRVVAYKWPTQLTSESIQLSLPDQWLYTLMFHKIAMKAELREFGRNDYHSEQFDKFMDRFITSVGHRHQIKQQVTPPRDV